MNKLKSIPFKKIILWIWMIFSICFIGLIIWNNIANSLYNKGFESAIINIVNRPEIKECKPLSLHDEKTSINLIDITCLQQQSGSGTAKK